MLGEDVQPYVELALKVFEPLLRAGENPEEAEYLLRELGYAPPSEVLAFREFGAVASSLIDVTEGIDTAIESGNAQDALPSLIALTVEVGRLFEGVNGFTQKIQSNFAGTQLLADTDILAEIARRLADYVIVRFLEDNAPRLGAVLQLAGVVEVHDVTETPTPFNIPYRSRVVNWDKLPEFFTDPVAALKSSIIAADEILYAHLLSLLEELALSFGLPAYLRLPEQKVLQSLNDGADLTGMADFDELTTLRIPLIADPAAELTLDIYPRRNVGDGKFTGIGTSLRFGGQLEVPLSESYRLVLKIGASLEDSLGVTISADGKFAFINRIFTSNPQSILDSVQFGVKLSVEPNLEAAPNKLFALGVAGGSRFEVGSGGLAFGVEKLDSLRLFAEGDLKDGFIVLKAAEGDGFISKILPAEGIESSFNIGVGISNQGGLYFKGSSGLELRLPVHVKLGAIEILWLGVGVKLEAGQIPLTVTGSFSGQLGPLSAAVEDIGLKAVFKFIGNRTGNLGPLDVSLGFKPPNGVGLAIDAGVVKGGGYLYFNFDEGEYAGALELTIQGFLSLKAIGLITTRMPDGSKGFSLIIIITAEFSPGIQMGFGFTLIGVGGLLGLNRTVVLEALAQGVRTGAVNGLLFPVDVIANAPRIISDMRLIFPPYSGRFLIGPMAKLGWGTPTLVSLALGVIIEIPGNVAILGVLKAILPDEKAGVLKLQVAFVGAIEFDKKRGWFFAALFESRVVFITLEGEMGLLIAVGNDANFVISVGGFHPRFTPPPLPFPSPKRIALDILRTPVARIRGEAYFAVTTNTAQFGARVELFFGFDSFSVEGHMVLDALLRFNPFYFIVEISAGVSLKVLGKGCFNISLEFSLEGTTPWRARGRGHIKLLFFKISKSFDETWGESQQTTLPPISVIPLLKIELDRPENWRALPPPANNLLVSLRKLELAAGELVLHPLGSLEVSQTQVPLGITIERVGAQVPDDANHFTLAVTSGGLVRKNDTRRGFPPAQFKKMSDAQKLSSPAFESEWSGLEIAFDGAELQTGRAVRRSLRYELTTIDTLYRRSVRRFQALALAAFAHFIKGAAVGKSAFSKRRRKQLRPFDDRIQVGDATFAVAAQDTNLRADAAPASFATQGAAQTWLDGLAANDPAKAATLHVIPSDEMPRAA
jgi:uncharacterized protein DUF6603